MDLLVSGDREVWFITWTSLRFSLASAVIACIPGIPLGVLIALKRFRGRRALLAVLTSLMALPTVVVGLIVYSLISRAGPLTAGLGCIGKISAVLGWVRMNSRRTFRLSAIRVPKLSRR